MFSQSGNQNGNGQTAISREYNKKIVKIIQALLVMDESIHFRKPITYRALGWLDYREVTKKAVDLNLVRRQYNQGKYSSVEEVLDDIQIIWDNVFVYDRQDHETFGHGIVMQKQYQEMVKELLPEFWEKVDKFAHQRKIQELKNADRKRKRGGDGSSNRSSKSKVNINSSSNAVITTSPSNQNHHNSHYPQRKVESVYSSIPAYNSALKEKSQRSNSKIQEKVQQRERGHASIAKSEDTIVRIQKESLQGINSVGGNVGDDKGSLVGNRKEILKQSQQSQSLLPNNSNPKNKKLQSQQQKKQQQILQSKQPAKNILNNAQQGNHIKHQQQQPHKQTLMRMEEQQPTLTVPQPKPQPQQFFIQQQQQHFMSNEQSQEDPILAELQPIKVTIRQNPSPQQLRQLTELTNQLAKRGQFTTLSKVVEILHKYEKENMKIQGEDVNFRMNSIHISTYWRIRKELEIKLSHGNANGRGSGNFVKADSPDFIY